MLFSSNLFLFLFLPAVLGIYYLLDRKMRNPFLLMVSLVFYAWGADMRPASFRLENNLQGASEYDCDLMRAEIAQRVVPELVVRVD